MSSILLKKSSSLNHVRSKRTAIRRLSKSGLVDGQGVQAHGIPPNPYNPHAWIIGNPKIGRGTWIGAFCLIDGKGGLEIGKGCDISCGAHILTHSTVKRCISERRYNQVDTLPTKIGNHVFVGENATILKGVEIGHHSVIGAGAVIKENSKIPAYSLVVGVPGRVARDLKGEVKLLKNGYKAKRKNTK